MEALRTFSLLAVFILSGCAGQIQANVQNFSNLPPDYAGKKVAVIATLEEQEKSLEWKRYKLIFEMHFAHQRFQIYSELSETRIIG